MRVIIITAMRVRDTKAGLLLQIMTMTADETVDWVAREDGFGTCSTCKPFWSVLSGARWA